VKDASAFLARRLDHRQLILFFVILVTHMRDLDQLAISSAIAMTRISPGDRYTDLFCAAGALQVEKDYRQARSHAKAVLKRAAQLDIPTEEMQEIYLAYWPERAKHMVS